MKPLADLHILFVSFLHFQCHGSKHLSSLHRSCKNRKENRQREKRDVSVITTGLESPPITHIHTLLYAQAQGAYLMFRIKFSYPQGIWLGDVRKIDGHHAGIPMPEIILHVHECVCVCVRAHFNTNIDMYVLSSRQHYVNKEMEMPSQPSIFTQPMNHI